MTLSLLFNYLTTIRFLICFLHLNNSCFLYLNTSILGESNQGKHTAFPMDIGRGINTWFPEVS